MSKQTVRFSFAFALLGMCLLGFSSGISAAGHGIGIQKECDTPARRCSTANQDDVCPDTDACTPRECNLEIQENLVCRFAASYNDSFGDTISLLGAWDQIDPFGANIRSPAAGNAEIIEVGGNTNCTVGGSLGCFIGPDEGGGAGFVVFQDDTFVPSDYFPAPGLPNPLVDQAVLQIQDNCESGDDSCNAGINFATFSAQTILVDGCQDGTPPDCDDNNVCTTDVCDPVDGCVNTPGALNCDDNNVCTTDTCDAIDGCVNTPDAGDCDDNNVCTTDTCDAIDGCVNTPGALDCDDNNVCTTDTCDAIDGCVNTSGALGDCDDNNVCTTDVCDPIAGCVNTPGALGDCDDNNVCTTDVCDPIAGCVNTPGALGDCDDGDVCTTDICDPILGCQNDLLPPEEAPPGCYEQDICLVVIDEEGVDNDFRSIENAASLIPGYNADELINDDNPTEVGNPPLLWNQLVANGQVPPAAQLVLLPTGQVDDEGWHALPPGPNILYKDGSRAPNCGLAGGYDEWIQRFVAGTLSQHCLDEVLDVMPLRNQELAELVGRTCVAVVYDSDISMNYEPIFGNLQGARYGLFTFTVEALELAGSLPESGSDTSLYDLWLRILPPETGGFPFEVDIHDHEPDAAELKQARYRNGILTVVGESDFNCSDTIMTVSVDGPDAGSDPLIDQFLLEEPILQCSNGRFSFQLDTGGVNVSGRRVSVQTNHGGVYNGTIR